MAKKKEKDQEPHAPVKDQTNAIEQCVWTLVGIVDEYRNTLSKDRMYTRMISKVSELFGRLSQQVEDKDATINELKSQLHAANRRIAAFQVRVVDSE